MKTIKLAIRSILHFRMYSGINMLGMALSLACVIIIFRYVYGELTVDWFNEKIDRVFVTTRELGENSGIVQFRGISLPDDETDITKDFGVEKVSDVVWFGDAEIEVNNRKYNARILAADSNFMEITNYPVISGADKLSEPNSALITEAFAQKLFGNESPVGKTFQYSTGQILTISGIIGQTSTKTSLPFDVIDRKSTRLNSSHT